MKEEWKFHVTKLFYPNVQSMVKVDSFLYLTLQRKLTNLEAVSQVVEKMHSRARLPGFKN